MPPVEPVVLNHESMGQSKRPHVHTTSQDLMCQRSCMRSALYRKALLVTVGLRHRNSLGDVVTTTLLRKCSCLSTFARIEITGVWGIRTTSSCLKRNFTFERLNGATHNRPPTKSPQGVFKIFRNFRHLKRNHDNPADNQRDPQPYVEPGCFLTEIHSS